MVTGGWSSGIRFLFFRGYKLYCKTLSGPWVRVYCSSCCWLALGGSSVGEQASGRVKEWKRPHVAWIESNKFTQTIFGAALSLWYRRRLLYSILDCCLTHDNTTVSEWHGPVLEALGQWSRAGLALENRRIWRSNAPVHNRSHFSCPHTTATLYCGQQDNTSICSVET